MPIESIDADLCTSCGQCEKSCPMDCIRTDEKTEKPMIAYKLDCMACYACEIDCPVDAIYVSPEKGMNGILMWD